NAPLSRRSRPKTPTDLKPESSPKESPRKSNWSQRWVFLGVVFGMATAVLTTRMDVARGTHVTTEQRPAVAANELGCRNNIISDCMALGNALSKAESSADLEKAAGAFRKACELGWPQGCTWLGSFTEEGKGGITANSQDALRLFERACSQR